MERLVKNKDVGLMQSHITITANEAGAGGASTIYKILRLGEIATTISFQTGNPTEEVNGITNEALLSIVLDRLQGFQKGPFPTRETALALTKIEEALHWMFSRSLDREERGTIGKLEK